MLHPPRILIVDDDPDVRRVFATAVGHLGEVHQAQGGAAAIRALDLLVFQLVLVDLHMPEVDGFAVLDHLRNRARLNREVPIIVVTADETDQARARALRSRSVYFLSKPVPLRVLRDVVESTLKLGAARSSRPPRD